MKKIVITTLALLTFTVFLALPTAPVDARTPIQTIKILIVPGHDNEVWGAQYKNIKEADMNLVLATDLYKILKKDKRFEVHITRDSLGYTTEFANYFGEHQDDINTFRLNSKAQQQNQVATGDFVEKEGTPHQTVSLSIANALYGINKWADENKMDAVIHIHFNDYGGHTNWTKGQYHGFAIYYPEEQMVNSTLSKNLGAEIFNKLHAKYVVSDYPPESVGLIPDQKLIAMGANGTLISSVRSVLIEYGYIYRFGNSAMRHAFYKDAAARTAKGIQQYFFSPHP